MSTISGSYNDIREQAKGFRGAFKDSWSTYFSLSPDTRRSKVGAVYRGHVKDNLANALSCERELQLMEQGIARFSLIRNRRSGRFEVIRNRLMRLITKKN